MNKIENLNSEKFSSKRLSFSVINKIKGGAADIDYSYDVYKTMVSCGDGTYQEYEDKSIRDICITH